MFKKLLLILAMALSVVANAQETVADSVSARVQTESVELLCMAGKLVRYGYKTKQALPLIQAIDIYRNLGVIDAESESTSGNTDTFTLNQIAADAVQFADGDETLLALIQSYGDTRGSEGGYSRRQVVVPADGEVSIEVRYKGLECAQILVNGNMGAKLGLSLYDHTGRLVESDDSHMEDCWVTYTPYKTAIFVVKIRNYANSDNRVVFTTN